MKNLLFTLALTLFVFSAYAQDPVAAPVDTSWKTGGFFNVNTTQVGLTNWAAGGENSFSLGSALFLFANYAKGNIEWNNNLGLGYAMLQSGNSTRKTDDKIDFTSKFGKKTSTHWFLTGLANFKTQFANGFNYPNDSDVISHFLAPGYVLLALGMDYKPSDHFSFFLSPATGKLIIINDEKIADAGTYGNDPAEYDADGLLLKHGNKTEVEFGAYVRIGYKQDIMQNVTAMAKLDLFNNYTARDPADRKNVVVNGELLIDMKVNKFISANINVVTIYDNKIDTDTNTPGIQRRLQVKEVIGVGFSFKF